MIKTTKFGISIKCLRTLLLYIDLFSDALSKYRTRRDRTSVDVDEVLSRAGNFISNAKDWDIFRSFFLSILSIIFLFLIRCKFLINGHI